MRSSAGSPKRDFVEGVSRVLVGYRMGGNVGYLVIRNICGNGEHIGRYRCWPIEKIVTLRPRSNHCMW